MNSRIRAFRTYKQSCVQYAVIVIALLICNVAAFGQDQYLYLTTNTMVARPLAMGGAYVAVEDALAAGLFNPANAGGYRNDRRAGFQLFLNPWTSTLALSRTSTFFEGEGKRFARALAHLGLLVKGMNVRLGPFDLSTIFNEQASSYSLLPEKIWDTDDYWNNQYNVLALRMRLAERVSVGGSLGLYYLKSPEMARRSWQVLASYGIALALSRTVQLGVSYLTVPSREANNQRDHPERIVDSSVNLGLSYRPSATTMLSLDLRNVVEESGRMVRREPHFGIEQSMFSLVALRLGSFYKLESEQVALSCGIGLFDLNWPRTRATHEQYPHWTVNYGVVGENLGVKSRRFIHAVTVAFRL